VRGTDGCITTPLTTTPTAFFWTMVFFLLFFSLPFL
jgi:hypothetical protein